MITQSFAQLCFVFKIYVLRHSNWLENDFTMLSFPMNTKLLYPNKLCTRLKLKYRIVMFEGK